MPERAGLFEGGYSPKVLAVAVGVGVASFLLALGLAAFEEELGAPTSAEPDSYSASAIGHKALIPFLEDSDVRVLVSRHRSARKAGPGAPLLLLAPELRHVDGGKVGGQEISAVSEMLIFTQGRGTPVVIAAPKWRAGKVAETRGIETWLTSVNAVPVDAVVEYLSDTEAMEVDRPRVSRRPGEAKLLCTTRWGQALEAELTDPQLLGETDELEPIVSCAEGLLVARVTDTQIYLVSDPDLLNNHGLRRGDNAAIILGLLREQLGTEAVVIDETHHGYVHVDSILAEMVRFPLSILTLHGLMVLAIVVWAGIGRFGRPDTPETRALGGRRVLIDNTARLLCYGGHTGASLARYFRLTLRLVARQLRMPAHIKLSDLTHRLQAASEARGIDVDLIDLSSRIARLEQGGVRGQAHRMVRMAEGLYRWREEILHGHRTHR